MIRLLKTSHLAAVLARGAKFAPFRRRHLFRLLDVALLRLRAFVVADDGIIANLSPQVRLTCGVAVFAEP